MLTLRMLVQKGQEFDSSPSVFEWIADYDFVKIHVAYDFLTMWAFSH
jgi:hypothetical protein